MTTYLGSLRRHILLSTLMIGLMIVVASITLFMLYQAAYKKEGTRLFESAVFQANVLENIIDQARKASPSPPHEQLHQTAVETLQAVQQHFRGMDRTWEFNLGLRVNNDLHILHYKDQPSSGKFITIPSDSQKAQAMQFALTGRTGLIEGLDYRGVEVLAAHAPVQNTDLGIVAKINIQEFKAPYIRAGLTSALTGTVLIIIGTVIFFYISTKIMREARENEIRLDLILDTVVDGIITIDKRGTITTFNQAAEKIFGYSADEAIGKNVNLLIPDSMHTQHDRYVKDYTDEKSRRIFGLNREVIGKRKDGTNFPMDLAVNTANMGKEIFFTGIVRDITRRRKDEQELRAYREQLEEQVKERTLALEQANEKLERLARRDSLTDIANRREFNDVLRLELSRAARNKSNISLLMCDLDYFKNFNDTYGHLAGDKCLVEIANILKQTFQRAGDLVARYGGEEFAVILPNTDDTDAEHLAKQLRQAVWDANIEHSTSSVDDRLTISIGVVTIVPANSHSDKLLIKAADDALYQAKRQGRNRYVISDTSKSSRQASA